MSDRSDDQDNALADALGDDTHDYQFKCNIIGDSGVGKSCLLLRISDNTYTDSYISTIGVDFKMTQLTVAQKTIRLQLWDTAGQERFRTITSSYYRGAHCIIVCFDVTDAASFDNLKTWLLEIDRYACENVNKMIIGCKSDLMDQAAVPEEEIRAFADSVECKVMFASAKTGENCDKVIQECAADVLERMIKASEEKNAPSASLSQRKKKNNKFFGC